MRKTLSVLALLAAMLFPLATPGPAAGAMRARDVLPAEGLVTSSVVSLRNQATLNAHYYLADEAVLGLGPKTDAVFARYRAGAGEALLLVVVYPAADEAGRVYERFGRDFFSESFAPGTSRFVEMIETGDWAGAAKRGSVLIVVLEAPDRAACDDLLRRSEDRLPAPKVK